MPLVINGLGGGHTHTHTQTDQHASQSNFKKPGARGHRPRAPCLTTTTPWNAISCGILLLASYIAYLSIIISMSAIVHCIIMSCWKARATSKLLTYICGHKN